VVLCLGAFFAVTAAISKEQGAGMDDELSGDQARIAKLIFKPQVEKKNDLLKRFEERKKQKASGEAAMKHRGDEGKAGKKDAPQKNARMAPQGKPNHKEAAANMLKNVFSGKGTSSVFGANDVGGALKGMTGNLFGASPGDSQGLFGKGLKGGGGGGGGDAQTIGISGVKTSGRGGGDQAFGSGVGVLGGKKSADIGITSGDPEVQGSLDKELIRKVIRDHRDQIRFCYESQLQRYPKLAGKVAVKFLITANGTVAVASVSQSTTGAPALDSCVVTKVKTWLFPKPKGGGVVTVNYPFNFKMAGE
jgi:TonB family protein